MLIKSATVVNEGTIQVLDVLIKDQRIERIDKSISAGHEWVVEAKGKYLLPGIIDDQVHFREPGLTHKATIFTESRAAVAGGITSYMEMPNTLPQTLTQELLEDKYARAAEDSLANYSFYMGASNDNIEEVLNTNGEKVCGVKVFMGSSTGNMLVDEEATLEKLFSRVSMLIATHCEDEATIRSNLKEAIKTYGEDIPMQEHPVIRSADACYKSSSLAVNLAKKYGTRLHILHISTAQELKLFERKPALQAKHITAEACIHHLWFTSEDYPAHGSLIKWNPAIKSSEDRKALREAVKNGTIDVVATDHAPHTLREKQNAYLEAPSGGPLVQHSLVAMLDLVDQKVFTLPEVVTKMCHHPADLFGIKKRGYLREGYFADLVLVRPKTPWTVTKDNILAKCGWSPFEGHEFGWSVEKTMVNGRIVYDKGALVDGQPGMRLEFKAR